jgi:hypothetical protein
VKIEKFKYRKQFEKVCDDFYDGFYHHVYTSGIKDKKFFLNITRMGISTSENKFREKLFEDTLQILPKVEEDGKDKDVSDYLQDQMIFHHSEGET